MSEPRAADEPGAIDRDGANRSSRHFDRTSPEHRSHLERSRRVWDFWSDHYEFNERDTREIRAETIDALGLEPGAVVADVGCGPGVNFELLRDRVGPEGRIVAVDYSPKMIDKARSRVDENGWENVEVVRADATRAVFVDERFDAAVSTLALSVMPDVRAATERVHRALRQGGRFAVLGVRLVPSGLGRALNPLVALFFRYAVNRNPEADVLAELDRSFGGVEVRETYALGTNFVAVTEKGR